MKDQDHGLAGALEPWDVPLRPVTHARRTRQAAAERTDLTVLEPGSAAAGRANSGDGGMVLLLSIDETARALGLGRSKIYELIAAGEIETVHIGRATRVPVEAVRAFVEQLRWQASAAAQDSGSRYRERHALSGM